MNPLQLLARLYPPEHPAHLLLFAHSLAVAERAGEIARRLGPEVDARFVREAALLHDIGIHFTQAPQLGCSGNLPYLCHGLTGGAWLRRHGLPRHALVCERHIGVGLTRDEILAQKLPLPPRDFLPLSCEEQIVAYADLFFSKRPGSAAAPLPAEEVRARLARFGSDKVTIFDRWAARFEG